VTKVGVARILHLGDLTDLLAVPLFEAIAPFDAVCVLRSTPSLNRSLAPPAI